MSFLGPALTNVYSKSITISTPAPGAFQTYRCTSISRKKTMPPGVNYYHQSWRCRMPETRKRKKKQVINAVPQYWYLLLRSENPPVWPYTFRYLPLERYEQEWPLYESMYPRQYFITDPETVTIDLRYSHHTHPPYWETTSVRRVSL